MVYTFYDQNNSRNVPMSDLGKLPGNPSLPPGVTDRDIEGQVFECPRCRSDDCAALEDVWPVRFECSECDLIFE